MATVARPRLRHDPTRQPDTPLRTSDQYRGRVGSRHHHRGHAYREFQRGRGNDVGIGPRLGHLLLEAGLELAEREAHYHIVTSAQFAGGGPAAAARPQMIAAGVAPPDAIARWDQATERLRSSPDAVLFMPQFIAVGRRTA